MKKKYTINLIALVLSSIFAILTFSLAVIMSETNLANQQLGQKEFEAIVVEISEREDSYTLKFEGNESILSLEKDTIINEDVLINLKQGDKVFFKVTKAYENFAMSVMFGELEVATIRTETKDIISEESFYRNDRRNLEATSQTVLMAVWVFGVIAFFNVLSIRRKRLEIKEKTL